jgi:hypothetical protein
MRFPAYLFVVRFGRKSIMPSSAMHAHPLLATEPPASLKTLTPFVAHHQVRCSHASLALSIWRRAGKTGTRGNRERMPGAAMRRASVVYDYSLQCNAVLNFFRCTMSYALKNINLLVRRHKQTQLNAASLKLPL